jgi:hypothetical protein
MQGIYNYISEINYVFEGTYSCSCSVFAISATRSVMVRVNYVLYFYINTLRSMCAVLNLVSFYSYLISCFPVMLLRHFLCDFEMVSVDPSITGVNFAFTFHMN